MKNKKKYMCSDKKNKKNNFPLNKIIKKIKLETNYYNLTRKHKTTVKTLPKTCLKYFLFFLIFVCSFLRCNSLPF